MTPRNRSWRRPPRTLRATRAGWCFIAIVFGVGFAALNTGNNLLYLVLALMLAFLVLSGLLSESALRGIRVERRLPRELFAEARNRISLRIHNAHPRTPSFAVTIDDRITTADGIEPAGRVFVLRVGPRSFADRSYLFEPSRRGDVRFEGLRVSTRFPFGLFVKSRTIDLPADGVVYPAIDTVPIVAVAPTNRIEDAEHARRTPAGDAIAGLREFVAGDSLSRIHWRSSLRAGRLFVGDREGESPAEIEIRLRLESEMEADMVEERVRRAASQVVRHLDAGFRVGLRTASIRFPAGAGALHRSELLTFLARVGAGEAGPPPHSVNHTRRRSDAPRQDRLESRAAG